MNTCEKLKERSSIPCDKGSKDNYKPITKASKSVFTIANASIYSNTSKYSGAVKACKKCAYLINR